MQARRSQMVRIIEWFENADLREVRACLLIVTEVATNRAKEVKEPTPFHKKRRARKPKVDGQGSMTMSEQEANAASA